MKEKTELAIGVLTGVVIGALITQKKNTENNVQDKEPIRQNKILNYFRKKQRVKEIKEVDNTSDLKDIPINEENNEHNETAESENVENLV